MASLLWSLHITSYNVTTASVTKTTHSAGYSPYKPHWYVSKCTCQQHAKQQTQPSKCTGLCPAFHNTCRKAAQGLGMGQRTMNGCHCKTDTPRKRHILSSNHNSHQHCIKDIVDETRVNVNVALGH